MHLDAPLLELLRDEVGRPELLQSQFGMGVDVVTDRGQFFLIRPGAVEGGLAHAGTPKGPRISALCCPSLGESPRGSGRFRSKETGSPTTRKSLPGSVRIMSISRNWSDVARSAMSLTGATGTPASAMIPSQSRRAFVSNTGCMTATSASRLAARRRPSENSGSSHHSG